MATVAGYLADLLPGSRKHMKALRRAIRSAAPGMTEQISYGIPCFKLDGRPVIWFAAWKKHSSLYPMGEDIRRRFAKELAGCAFSRGTIRFPWDRQPSPELVRQLVRARVAEVRAVRAKTKTGTLLARIRTIALALPDATEKQAWGEPTFRVSDKLFAMYADADNHHGEGRPAVWVKAQPDNQAMMIAMDPKRFFKPPYVGPNGWIGVWLDGRVSWKMVADVLADGHRLTARKPPRRASTRSS